MHTDPHPLILFLHIQKTAGSTLQALLRRNLGESPFQQGMNFLLKRSREGLTLKDAAESLTEKDRLFMGHFCFGIHRHIPFPARYMTFLRDPYRRLVSLYQYSRNNPRAFYHKFACSMTMEAFFSECPLLELDNGMTRFIAGDSVSLFINRTPYGKCTPELLDLALDNLNRHFDFVGIQETFPQSVFALSQELKLRDPFYLSLNRGASKSAEGTEDLRELVMERNPLDFQLYAHCRQQFEERYGDMTSGDSPEYRDFLSQNEVAQPSLQRKFKIRLRVRRALEMILFRPRAHRLD